MKLCVKFWCKDDIQFQFLSGAAEQGREAAERSSEQSYGGDAHAGAHNLQQVWKNGKTMQHQCTYIIICYRKSKTDRTRVNILRLAANYLRVSESE